MPNRKTHFIAGALAGASISFLIQSTKMAMDYDRPFDWRELFLCAGAGAVAGLAPDIGPRLCRRPAAEIWFRETVPNLLTPLPKLATTPNHRQFFHRILSAGLIAYAISSNHTLKLSRTTRLTLWVFGMSYFSHIALYSALPSNLQPSTFQPSTPNLL